jgi:hypothetical protein
MPVTTKLTRKGAITLGLCFLSAATGAAGYGVYTTVDMADGIVQTATEKSAGKILQDDITAAIAAEIEEQKAEAAKAPGLKKTCDDTAASINETLANMDINAKARADFDEPDNFYPGGECAIYLGDKIIGFMQDPEEINEESEREFIVKNLLKELRENNLTAPRAAFPKP